MTRLTKAQLRTLKTCADEGSIIFGGIDATHNVRRNTVTRLATLGFVRWRAPGSLYEESAWILTDRGREFLKQQETP